MSAHSGIRPAILCAFVVVVSLAVESQRASPPPRDLAHSTVSEHVRLASSGSAPSLVRLRFDDYTPAKARATAHRARIPLAVSGDRSARAHLAKVSTRVSSVADGRGGRALRLPPLGTGRAVATVATSSPTSLTPRDRRFVFGARFKIDSRSDGHRLDDGNNLVQRGLWGDQGQYKLQVDRGQVSCRVLGRGGEAVVTARVQITPGSWHRARCARHARLVRLTVTKPDGTPIRAQRSIRTGRVAPPPTARLAVGGKVTARGIAVRGDSDQFNGVVDNVYVKIAGTR